MAGKNLNKQNKYALVTGGTSGIGYELSKLCAKGGFNLVLVARSSERLHEVSQEFMQYGVDVISMDQDLFEPDAGLQIYQELKAKGVDISILINNAGQGQLGKFHEVPLERHLALIQLNITALVTLTRAFLDDMIARGEGRILNLASVVSKTPAPEFSVYAASKAFVLSFSEALAQELEDTNITVTALLPGRTDTDFFYKADMEDSKEYQEHKLADAEKVALDGYEAMMSGESRVISGMQNKMMVGMMNTMSDSANAEKMQKNMQPTDKDEANKRHRSDHPASQEERESMIDKDRGDLVL